VVIHSRWEAAKVLLRIREFEIELHRNSLFLHVPGWFEFYYDPRMGWHGSWLTKGQSSSTSEERALDEMEGPSSLIH
jgi:hypothetical protein